MKAAKFYRSGKDFREIHQNLKFTPCPHCKRTDALILHGYRYGYDLKTGKPKTARGRRIFCSNRHRKQGCGRTFSILKTRFIKHFMIPASTLWMFLMNIASGLNTFRAFERLDFPFTPSSIYRISKRVSQCQAKIRSLLINIAPVPGDVDTNNPLIQTILHLRRAFKGCSNAVAAFQGRFQTSFL